MNDGNLEQWINITFCVKIGNSASETLALLPYVECVMKKSRGLEWQRHFKEGQEDVQNDPEVGSQKRKVQMHVCTKHGLWCLD
jgi:hypothetical protein